MHSVDEVYPGEHVCHENRPLAVTHYRDACHYAEKHYVNVYFLNLRSSMQRLLCDPHRAYNGLQAREDHIEEEVLVRQKVMRTIQCQDAEGVA